MAGHGVAASMSPSDLRTASKNDHNDIINAVGKRLQSLGVSKAYFQEGTYLKYGFTSSLLASLLKVFNNIDHEKVLDLGIDHNHHMKAGEFYDFLLFLHSSTGQTALNQMENQLEEERSAWISLFEVQRYNCAIELWDKRRKIDAEIATLELQLCKLRAELDDNQIVIRSKFAPASFYEPLDTTSLNKACWEKYLRNCQVCGDEPFELTTTHLIEAVRTYSGRVRKRHILDYSGRVRKRLLLRSCGT